MYGTFSAQSKLGRTFAKDQVLNSGRDLSYGVMSTNHDHERLT